MTPTALIMLAVASAAAPVPADSSRNLPLDEVVVTGSNSAVGRNLIPYTVSVVDSRQIEASTDTRLLSTLSAEVPSLFVSQRGILGFGVSNGGAGHIKMRGVGGDRASAVLMMVDGQPQFAGIYSHHVADFYTKDHVEKVEVLRGPGSVLYGSNAMAGVINVITRSAGQTDGVRTTLSSKYGSYNTWMSTFTNTVRSGRFSSLASVSFDRTDGTCRHFDFRQWSGYAKIAYDFNDHWTGTADYTLMNFKGNDPIYPRLEDPRSTDIFHQNVTRGEASVAVTNRFATTSGAVRMYYSYGNHFIDDPRHFHSVDDRFGILAYQNVQPWTMADMTIGFDLNTYSGAIRTSGGRDHNPGSLSTMGRKRIVEYSPYLTLAQGFFDKSLVINGGVRMANSDMFGTQWIPQAGVVYNAPFGLTAKASLSMGYRNPSFRELYLYRMANPDLHPEKMMNYEVSVGKQFSRWFGIDVTAYWAKGRDMIQVLDRRNVNTGSFINKGIEVSARSHPIDCLRLTATYSYLHTSLRNLTSAPRQQYYVGASWTVIPRLTIDANLKGAGGLYVADDIERQNFALLGAKITYRVCRQLDLFVEGENLTDIRYEINRGYTMPGSTAMGGFRLSL